MSDIISDSLRHLGSMPTPAVSLIVCVIIAMLTEVTTNSATTALLLPIVADLVRTRSITCSYENGETFCDSKCTKERQNKEIKRANQNE